MFQQNWIQIIRQSLRRFFASRGANTDITSLTGLTGPLTRASYLDLSEQAAIANPVTDTARVGAIDVEGMTSMIYRSATGFEARILRDQLYIVRNSSGVNLTKGTVVKINGTTGNGSTAAITVTRAQANAAGTMPAFGILAQDVNNNAFGRCMVVGRIDGLNTSSYAALDVLFVSPTVAGGLTNVRPSTPNRAQPIAQVINSHATAGAITVLVDPVLNEGLSTVQNTFTIGDSTPGVKSLKFAGTTVRSLYDGSTAPTSPVVGDTWTERNSSTQAIVERWEWNGTYWLSQRTFESQVSANNTPNMFLLNVTPFRVDTYNYWIDTIELLASIATTNDATNHWSFMVSRVASNNLRTIIHTTTTKLNAVGVRASGDVAASVGLHIDTVATSFRQFDLRVDKVGSPGNFFGAGTLIYRLARR